MSIKELKLNNNIYKTIQNKRFKNNVNIVSHEIKTYDDKENKYYNINKNKNNHEIDYLKNLNKNSYYKNKNEIMLGGKNKLKNKKYNDNININRSEENRKNFKTKSLKKAKIQMARWKFPLILRSKQI